MTGGKPGVSQTSDIGLLTWLLRWVALCTVLGLATSGWWTAESDGSTSGSVVNLMALAAAFGAMGAFATLPLRNRSRMLADSLAPSRNWIRRGLAVGLVLGAAYGSWIPLLGTAVGLFLGASAGLVVGAVVAAESALSRKLLPTTAVGTARRERAFAVGTVLLGVGLVGGGRRGFATDSLGMLYVPAAIVTLHTLIAGSPSSSNAD